MRTRHRQPVCSFDAVPGRADRPSEIHGNRRAEGLVSGTPPRRSAGRAGEFLESVRKIVPTRPTRPTTGWKAERLRTGPCGPPRPGAPDGGEGGRQGRNAARVGLVLLLVALSAATAAPATARERPDLRAFERVRGLRFEAPARSGPGRRPRAALDRGTLRFEALDRRFAVRLESNRELLVDLPDPVRAELEGVELFKGPIEGRDRSWTRLARVGGQWAGLLYDGGELLAIEPESGLGNGTASPAIAYRLADAAPTGTCAIAGAGDPLAGDAPSELPGLAGLSTLAAAAARARLFIDVAVIGDERFTRNQLDPMGLAAALFNAVDGLYTEQVGVSLNVVDIALLDSDGGLLATRASRLLDELATLAGSRALDNPGLVHLLTGRNLDGATVGIAFIGSLCSESTGVALSQVRNGSFGSSTILIAHEIGHNFGAPHDGELGSACSATPPGFVMSPNLDDTSDRFSSCSLDQMEPEISTARCLGELRERPEVTAPCLFDADFGGDPAGFVFKPDKQTPRLTVGAVTPGGLQVDVGGVNRKNAKKMKGTWKLACRVDEPTPVTITLDGSLVHSASYDDGEKSKLRLRVNDDKTLLAKIVGADDDGGLDRTTGSRTWVVDAELPAGVSRIRLECLNNRKTGRREVTRCGFERLTVEAR